MTSWTDNFRSTRKFQMAHGLLNKFAAGLRVRSKVQPRHDVTAQNGLEGRHTYYKTYTLIMHI